MRAILHVLRQRGSARDQGAETNIKPALSVDQWSKREYERSGENGVSLGLGTGVNVVAPGAIDDPADVIALIALANAALPVQDPRKFTREHVRLLRGAAELIGGSERGFATDGADRATAEMVAERVVYSQLLDLADVIESYLPPRLTK